MGAPHSEDVQNPSTLFHTWVECSDTILRVSGVGNSLPFGAEIVTLHKENRDTEVGRPNTLSTRGPYRRLRSDIGWYTLVLDRLLNRNRKF